MNEFKFKIFIVSLLCLFGFNPTINAQYDAQNIYLQNPDAIRPYILQSAEFWKKSVDWEDGGFYSNVNQDGTPKLTTRKSFVQCSRHAYGFSRAFMVSGNEEYLDYANHAAQFVYDHAWDSNNQGWFFSSDKLGNTAPPYGGGWNPNNEKWSFQQHYDVLGIGAMAEATRAPLHMDWLELSSHVNDSLLWDSRNGFEGFFESANVNWTNPRGKGFTATVDAITTWVLTKVLLSNEQADKERFLAVADNIVDHLYESMLLPQVKFGFAEQYNNNWGVNMGAHEGSVGHVIKTSWCLARAFMLDQKQEYLDVAQFMIDDMMMNGGYDFTNGGLFTSYNWQTGQVEQNKDYWMLEQGVTGGLINYFLAENPNDRDRNLEMADGSLSFFMEHLVDEEFGEIFSQTDATGTVINAAKSDPFKGGYHNIEMAYLVYVYANLFLQNKPITLYYRFKENTEARVFKMTPLAIIDNLLEIKTIQLDDAIYTNFDPITRELNIPPNIGGIFKITYQLNGTFVSTSDFPTIDPLIVYPNPTLDNFYIKNISENTEVEIYSLAGRLIGTYKNIAADESISIKTLVTGTYFLKIKMDGKIYRKKIVKI